MDRRWIIPDCDALPGPRAPAWSSCGRGHGSASLRVETGSGASTAAIDRLSFDFDIDGEPVTVDTAVPSRITAPTVDPLTITLADPAAMDDYTETRRMHRILLTGREPY